MSLDECIEEIITGFNKDDYFDSHVIINELITEPKYHIVYLQEYSRNCNINQFHGLIAQKIGQIRCINPKGNSKSHTIYGDISDNQLWQKN